MKKLFTIILISLVICSVVYAETRVSAKVSPYSYQYISAPDRTENNSIASYYGFGVSAAIEKFYANRFSLGLGVGVDSYYFSNDEESNVIELSIFPIIGYNIKVSDTTELFAKAKLEVTEQILEDVNSYQFTPAVELGIGYTINEKLDFTFSVEGIFGFARSSEETFRSDRINTNLGLYYKF